MLHGIAASVPISSYCPQQASPFVKQKLHKKKKKKKQVKRVWFFIQATSIPAFPGQQARQTADNPGSLQNPDPNSRTLLPPAQTTFVNSKWHRDDESALNKCEPLPLPMAYPGSTPAPQDVERMKNCNPEIKDCRDVIYQWTGECSRCQGTGEVSSYRKKGREVICKCINCLGLGHVYKMTLRTDIDIIEEVDGAS